MHMYVHVCPRTANMYVSTMEHTNRERKWSEEHLVNICIEYDAAQLARAQWTQNSYKQLSACVSPETPHRLTRLWIASATSSSSWAN